MTSRETPGALGEDVVDKLTRLAELEGTTSSLRHDLFGILAPALLVADWLLAHADPKVVKAGETVVKAIKRAEERLVAERRAGQLLKGMDKARAGRPSKNPSTESRDFQQPLADLGISYNQSSQWQKLADVDSETFEQAVKQDRPTTAGIVAKVEPPREPKKNAVSAPALWFWGRHARQGDGAASLRAAGAERRDGAAGL